MTITPTSLDHKLLARCVEVSQESRDSGNHPFGAVLATPEGKILLESGNTVTTLGDLIGHAETNLIRAAGMQFDAQTLATATLYSTGEPCAMCSGALYWSGIGRLVYGYSEAQLREITGSDDRNLTMDLPCRQVFAAGQRPVTVIGPVDLPGAAEVHQGFWT
jgi:tRNA(Arg) A34 adenosine deaminase TadA